MDIVQESWHIHGLNMQYITPNLKIWLYSYIPGDDTGT